MKTFLFVSLILSSVVLFFSSCEQEYFSQSSTSLQVDNRASNSIQLLITLPTITQQTLNVSSYQLSPMTGNQFSIIAKFSNGSTQIITASALTATSTYMDIHMDKSSYLNKQNLSVTCNSAQQLVYVINPNISGTSTSILGEDSDGI
jgi:hypothetical protein